MENKALETTTAQALIVELSRYIKNVIVIEQISALTMRMQLYILHYLWGKTDREMMDLFRLDDIDFNTLKCDADRWIAWMHRALYTGDIHGCKASIAPM